MYFENYRKELYMKLLYAFCPDTPIIYILISLALLFFPDILHIYYVFLTIELIGGTVSL